jgi:hypothetical protein
MSTAAIPDDVELAYSDEIQRYIFSAFAGIVWYNAVELIVVCFVTFRRYRGCYFWSLLVSSFSLIPHVLGYIFLLFPLDVSPWLSVSFVLVPWCGMVTGQSLVLWSRLHLVLQSPKVLWGVLCMIIINGIAFHTPVFVLMYGIISPKADLFTRGYDIMERIQLVGFCVQELVLSGLYIYETAKLLRLRPEQRHRQILVQLLVINIFILILDVAVVGTEYAGYYAVQVMFKPVAYSIKLKLEYAILGKLVEIAQGVTLDSWASTSPRNAMRSDYGIRLGSGGEASDHSQEVDSTTVPPEVYVTDSPFPRCVKGHG